MLKRSSAATRGRWAYGASVFSLAAAIASSAAAQTPDDPATSVDDVVVTGSLIRGTAEDAALPVEVLSRQDLLKEGSPALVDIIKSIPAMQGVLGEANQYQSAQTTGAGNVNLRGLGSSRTLVLMNGRRLATSPHGTFVDTNLLPAAAVGRIEVLKDGAAATYGSDAIGGVVNFITRRDLNGLEVSANHQFIDGSDGDSNISVNYGWVGERGNVLLSAAYKRRSELARVDREGSLLDYDTNPGGSWSSFGNPGVWATSPFLTAASRFADPACETLGGVLRVSNSSPTCYFQFGAFGNLVEEEHHYQFYAETNVDISDKLRFHAEVTYASHDVPREKSSPSYAPVQNPPDSINGPAPNNQFYVPLTNPGLAALLPQLTAAQQAAIRASGGVYTLGLFFRPFGAGGNPITGGGKEDRRFFDGTRFSAGFNGDFGDGWQWDVNATHMVNRADISTPDIVLSRLQYAMRGLGGEGCDPRTGTPGAGPCQYFNPFSTGIAGHATTGQVNPFYVPGSAAANANNAEIAEWMSEAYAFKGETTLTVFDATINGELPWDFLPGGRIGAAAGVQYRYTGFNRTVSEFTNTKIHPCPIEGDNTCTLATGRGNGPLIFFGPIAEMDFDSTVFAAFAEIQAPLTETLNLQLAARYEDFGGNIGSTFNPKVALRWQALEAVALRGSYGTTFRAPPQSQILPDYITTMNYQAEAGGYRPTDTYGNPYLQPETATTLNLGGIFRLGGLSATLDYWAFDFSDPITNESAGNMISVLVNSQCTGLPAAFLERFTPTNGVPFGPGACAGSNLARIRSTTINGSYIKTSGFDFSADYDLPDVWGGRNRIGVNGSYVLEYSIGEQTVEGVKVRDSFDLVGTLGTGPELRGNVYAEHTRGDHNLRLTVRYIGSQIDTRNGDYGTRSIFTPASPLGAEIPAFVTADLAYRVILPWDATFTAVVSNIFDEDPPFARLDLNYDTSTGNPLGRTFKIGLTKRF